MIFKDVLLERELSLARDLGFKSREEFLGEAVRTYLAARKDLRVEMAVGLYKKGEISLGKAKELAGLSIEELKEDLDERGIDRLTSDVRRSLKYSREYRGKGG